MSIASVEHSTSIEILPSRSPKRRPVDSELGFGRVFTDHMFLMDWDDALGWHSARIVPYAPLAMDPAAGALHYGQAMFDGMKAFRSVAGRVRLFRAERHCRRMAEGAPRLAMPSPDPVILHEAIARLVSLDADWVPRTRGTALYIRPTLIASEPYLGVRPAERYLLFVILSPVGPYYPGGLRPLRIWVEDRYVRAAPGGTGAVKAAGNYAASLLPAREAQARGCDQVLWLDAVTRRRLEEMGVMNVFVLLGETLHTPPLRGTILGGVTRDSILTLARDWGVAVEERDITIDEIEEASHRGELREVFGCGTAAVIAPVGELLRADGAIPVSDGEVGPLARRLHDAITAIQYGEADDPHGWMEEVPAPEPA